MEYPPNILKEFTKYPFSSSPIYPFTLISGYILSKKYSKNNLPQFHNMLIS